MLYDPAPLNDLGDPGHDMSAYMNYSGGGLSYDYRRSRRMELDEPAEAAEPAEAHAHRRRMDARHLAAAEVHAGRARPAFSHEEITQHRRLASAVETDWRNRMVFYQGDERAFYQGLDSRVSELPLPRPSLTVAPSATPSLTRTLTLTRTQTRTSTLTRTRTLSRTRCATRQRRSSTRPAALRAAPTPRSPTAAAAAPPRPTVPTAARAGTACTAAWPAMAVSSCRCGTRGSAGSG